MQLERRDQTLLEHMLHHAKQAHGKVAGIDQAAFEQDDTLALAVAHLIQIIGEAASRVSRPVQEELPDVPDRHAQYSRARLHGR